MRTTSKSSSRYTFFSFLLFTTLSQVQKWREKQLEVLEVRQKLEESKRQAELEKLQEENERFQKHRQQMKEKVRCFLILRSALLSILQVNDYHSKKEQTRLAEYEKEHRRLEEMQLALAEQQRKDWERIKFRQEEYERKREELQERHEMEEREQHEREERLQAIADRVRPHVQADYARVLQPTQVIRLYSPHFSALPALLGFQCSPWFIN